MMKPDDNLIVKEQRAYSVFRTRLDEAAGRTETLENMLQMEDVLYDILQQEFQMNDMLNAYIERKMRDIP